MPDWTWKQAVADCVLDTANRRGRPEFTLADVYRRAHLLQQRFPRNRHVREKARQILQQLRDDGFILFRGGGRYVLNLDFEEIDTEPAAPIRAGSPSPATRRTLRSVRLRDTLLAAEIRRRYTNICQVCPQRVRLTATTNYAEGHHLRPLGNPHLGPDRPGNIIVLCPNHHKMFDRGVATVYPRTLRVVHLVRDVFPPDTRLHVEPWHQLSAECIAYHHTRIFRARVG